MFNQYLSVKEASAYLNLSPEDIHHRVTYREIPFQRRGARVVFTKSQIDEWASQRILNLPSQRLAAYHDRSTQATGDIFPQQTILPALLQPGFIALAMPAKTKASVLRELVELAGKTGRLNDPAELLASLEHREALGSTAMPGGFALPHPRCHDPYIFESSFLVVGRTVQEIHFGAEHGEPTNLFFLICCQDDRLHLHTLTRLCLVLRNTNLLEQLNIETDAEIMFQKIIAAEAEVLTESHPPRDT